MAKWLKEHLGLGPKRIPPQPPRPDYTRKGSAAAAVGELAVPITGPGADLLTVYRAQKDMDFEDPYNGPCSGALQRLKLVGGAGGSASPGSSVEQDSSDGVQPAGPQGSELKVLANKRRLIKVEAVVTKGLKNDTGKVESDAGEENGKSKEEKVIILEDYADPFDAEKKTKGQKDEAGKENDGYMEPYEAQRMIKGMMLHDVSSTFCLKHLIRAVTTILPGAKKQNVKETPRRLPLYDTPYEPKENGGDEGDIRETPTAPPAEVGSPGEASRDNRLPQDDERPADEYDQPWEWNKEKISKALAVQFDEVERSRAASLLVAGEELQQQQQRQRQPSGGRRASRRQSLEQTSPGGERIDPSVPLERQVWYHGSISRSEAETLLRLCKESSYLVRNSETSRNDFSLSLKSSKGFMHMKVSRTKEHKYILGQNSLPFDTVPEVIHHYSSRKLPVKGAEHLSLLYPVAVRTL
uniref:SH2 domain-containing adapter protein F-like isoform X2 n=1 Tax=Myxine glutinosa TaxID=7769 RepID=UPI00358F5149